MFSCGCCATRLSFERQNALFGAVIAAESPFRDSDPAAAIGVVSSPTF